MYEAETLSHRKHLTSYVREIVDNTRLLLFLRVMVSNNTFKKMCTYNACTLT